MMQEKMQVVMKKLECKIAEPVQAQSAFSPQLNAAQGPPISEDNPMHRDNNRTVSCTFNIPSFKHNSSVNVYQDQSSTSQRVSSYSYSNKNKDDFFSTLMSYAMSTAIFLRHLSADKPQGRDICILTLLKYFIRSL